MNHEADKPALLETCIVPGVRLIGRRLLIYDRLASTNTHALELADDPAKDGLVVLAREQSAGRGQHGRSWLAPPGSSILMSVLLFPPGPLQRPALLTAWAAVSLSELIHEITGLQASIKWPNDVLVGSRKVCGILIEQRSFVGGIFNPSHSEGRIENPSYKLLATVAGIGLNVNQDARWFAAAKLPEAASLATLAKKEFDCRLVMQTLIQCLDDEYRHLQEGDLAALELRWKRRLELLDKQVAVDCSGEIHLGRLKDIAFNGLELDTDSRRLTLMPETIRHITVV
jgi:BirA family biotin operon repressor/biotin-[acetyl-CoA-carboxylase] ligase